MLARLLPGGSAARLLVAALAAAAITGTVLVISTRTSQHDARIFRGTVTAVTEKDVAVHQHRGASRTFLRADGTQVYKDRRRANWSDIVQRSYVTVKYQERDGKFFARRINVGREHVRGRVEAVKTGALTIGTADGHHVTVMLYSDTKYFQASAGNQKPGSLTEIRPGTHVVVSGGWDAGDTFDAASVVYSTP